MFESIIKTQIDLSAFIMLTAVSLLLGTASAWLSCYKNHCSRNFAITLAMLPVMVQVVIMLVNGNLGTGVAVAGAFGLVRFRSVPGTAREIGAIVLVMTIGLATGMGYLFLAILFFVIVAAFLLLLNAIGVDGSSDRELVITIPENLDYDGLFDDILAEYTKSAVLNRVKTTNLGSLYELHYTIHLKDKQVPKAFLDALRCRNGNLNIVCGKVSEKNAL